VDAWAVLLLRLIWKAVNWAVDYFVITTERLLLTTGLLTGSGDDATVKGHRHELPPVLRGRLLGYGE